MFRPFFIKRSSGSDPKMFFLNLKLTSQKIRDLVNMIIIIILYCYNIIIMKMRTAVSFTFSAVGTPNSKLSGRGSFFRN